MAFVVLTHHPVAKVMPAKVGLVSTFENDIRYCSPCLVRIVANGRTLLREHYVLGDVNVSIHCLQRRPSELPLCHPPLIDVFYGGQMILS